MIAVDEDLGAGDVRRHEVGRELDAVKTEVEDPGNGPHHQRLGQAGHTGDQAVAAGEERNENLLDRLLLPDDDPAKFLFYFFTAGGDLLDRLPILLVCGLSCCCFHWSMCH